MSATLQTEILCQNINSGGTALKYTKEPKGASWNVQKSPSQSFKMFAVNLYLYFHDSKSEGDFDQPLPLPAHWCGKWQAAISSQSTHNHLLGLIEIKQKNAFMMFPHI